MTDAVESMHMGHPDFRVNNRIFATLHADNQVGMVKLTPDQQKRFVEGAPAAFAPESGAWGRSGCTSVRLEAVDADSLGEAMTLAWKNLVSKSSPPRRTLRTQRSIPSSK
jgi:hypothetical protein